MKVRDFINENLTPNWKVFESKFPEMNSNKHSMRFHKEGSVLTHTKLVTEAMVKILNNTKDLDSEYIVIMLGAAMFHDIGKPSTTFWNVLESDWSCKDHGKVGETIFREVFFDEDVYLREKIGYLVRNHMVLHNILSKKESQRKKKYEELKNGIVPIEYLITLLECDMLGSYSSLNEDENERLKKIYEKKDKILEDIKTLTES